MQAGGTGANDANAGHGSLLRGRELGSAVVARGAHSHCEGGGWGRTTSGPIHPCSTPSKGGT
ncbi:hypothetical protein DB31_6581 [Hyalangium minutum]|uniref:Uncharacterized protein n=1 Tax=Hyalangium minutum TaxID=394096 RepID=A0A085WPJ3_9BACT|nr:hypothetical protein DB31_6581 [Hyalangium minutum]